MRLVCVLTALCTSGLWHGWASADRCIAVIGGNKVPAVTPAQVQSAPPVEYYHPTKAVCELPDVHLSSDRLGRETDHTSGCYLAATQQIVIRDARHPHKPAITYRLGDGTAIEAPLLYKTASSSRLYSHASATAAIGTTQCLSCGGHAGREAPFLNACFVYDNANNRWNAVIDLPDAVFGAAAVALGNNFYIVGGESASGLSNRLWRIDVATGVKWEAEAPMAMARYQHAAAALSADEFIVCGGWGQRRQCEIYSEYTSEWRPAADLLHGRAQLAMVNFNGRVYAIGGHGRGDTVEVYDAVADSWTWAKPLGLGRRAFMALVL